MEKYDIPTYFVCRILIVTIFILLATSAKTTLYGRLVAVENRQTEKEEQLQAAQKISDNQKSVVSAFKSLKDKNYQEQYNALEHNIKIIPKLSRAPRECIPEKIGSYYGYIPVLGRDLMFVTSVKINGYEVYNIVTKDDLLELYNVCITRNGKIMDDNAVGNVYMYPAFALLPLGSGAGFDTKLQYIESAQDILRYGVTDLNNNGIPEISINAYESGAHGWSTIRITELDDKATLLFARELLHDTPQLIDLNNDGLLEIVAWDWSFAYWNASFMQSPTPNIAFRYDHSSNKYIFDNSLVSFDAPSDDLLSRQAAGWNWESRFFEGDFAFNTSQTELARNNSKYKYSVAWAYAVELIFYGFPNEAKKYIKLAWDNGEHQDGSLAHFADFWRLFGDTMKKSPNYPDLAHTIPEGYWE